MARRRRPKMDDDKLTELLAEIGSEAVTIDDNGDPVTRKRQLAELMWKKAMGYVETEEIQDEYGNKSTIEVQHNPERWALEAIYDRLEGRPGTAQQEVENRGPTATEKVSALAKERMAAFLAKTAYEKTSPKFGGPPKVDPDA